MGTSTICPHRIISRGHCRFVSRVFAFQSVLLLILLEAKLYWNAKTKRRWPFEIIRLGQIVHVPIFVSVSVGICRICYVAGRQVCWISSTYYLPDETAVPGQPGIIKRHISYYQWVPVVLLAQALLFRMPCTFWRIFSDRSGININNLVEAAETIQNALYPERREKTIRYMIRHLDHYLDYQHDYRGGGRPTIHPRDSLLRPGSGRQYCDQFVCLSVCLSVCSRAYLWNRWTDLHEILYADPPWPWLGRPRAALGYVYVLPVLWMTSRLVVMGRMAMRGRLNL